MDFDFFKELEDSISNIGSDEVWKETIGGHKIWLSPISFTSQAKVQDNITNNDLGSNVIGESKRITLSHAIVGINDIDLRPYRNSGPVFGPVPLPGGKSMKVDLPGYLYLKMSLWGSQFIDDCFAVFADRLETHSKENLKEVKFENAKHPMEELSELMMRVTELRIQLGLPELVEQNNEISESQEFERSIRNERPDVVLDDEPDSSSDSSFDPFKPVPVEERVKPAFRPSAPAPAPTIDVGPVSVATNIPQPFVDSVNRSQSFAELEGHTTSSSPQNPFVATRSNEVLEPQVREPVTTQPVIDQVKFQKNPRFAPQKV